MRQVIGFGLLGLSVWAVTRPNAPASRSNPRKPSRYNSLFESLDKNVLEAFEKIGELQRGKPEEAMRKIQQFHSGVLAFVVEHAGDLTHRLTEQEGKFGRGLVLDKAEKVLATLRHKYGFEKEHCENIAANLKYGKLSLGEYDSKLDSLLLDYAKEHEKLPVYNEFQRMCREVPILIGKQDFKKAAHLLEKIVKISSDKERYESLACEHTTDDDGNLVELS